jgi:hypothetical protein
MSGMLSDLYLRIPVVRCKILFAIRTLSIFFNEFYDLTLLNSCSLVNNSYKLNFYFDSL